MGQTKKRLSKFLNFNKTLANAVLEHFAACGITIVDNFLHTPYKGASPAELLGLTQRLEKNGFIKRTTKNNREFFILTEKGRNMANLLKFREMPQQKWDGKWRVIIFDVKEKNKKARNFLRKKLKELGFVQLQKSVWVFPHPIPKAFDWLLEEVGLKFSIRYLVVDSINYEKDLLRKFNLKR